jgi:hypothetical protein
VRRLCEVARCACDGWVGGDDEVEKMEAGGRRKEDDRCAGKAEKPRTAVGWRSRAPLTNVLAPFRLRLTTARSPPMSNLAK